MFHVYATQLLRNDHKMINGLFLQFDAIQQRLWEQGSVSEGSVRKSAIVDEIFAILEIHSAIEEGVFYPAVAEASSTDIHGRVDEAFKDHGRMAEMIAQLRKTNLNSEEFVDRLNELKSEVLGHVEFEESVLLPWAENKISARLGELGMQMEARKEELMSKHEWRINRNEAA